jgi:hypothetical protein
MTMADVDRLLQEFIEEDRTAGPADPAAYLARVPGEDQAELEARIDNYLAEAPRRPFNREAFMKSPARGIAEELGRALGGASGTWPALLPRLRHRAQLRRVEVVSRLSEELGAGGEAQVAKVASYYHGMEQGTLPAAGVSDRVLEALARIVGVSVDRLREAGRAAGGEPGPAAAAAFARVGSPDPRYVEPSPAPERGEPTPAAERDEIDELFTGASAQPS